MNEPIYEQVVQCFGTIEVQRFYDDRAGESCVSLSKIRG